jgi:Transposase DDE domain
MQLDGSHKAAKRGGEAIGYQGRKEAKTTNSWFLADNSGQMMAFSYPRADQHHDLYQLETVFKELLDLLKSAGVDTWGVFLNADSGFYSRELRQICSAEETETNIKANPRNTINDSRPYHYFDEELYKRWMIIEQENAWLSSFKSLLIRFETSARNWMLLHWMAFSIGFLRKFNTCIKA